MPKVEPDRECLVTPGLLISSKPRVPGGCPSEGGHAQTPQALRSHTSENPFHISPAVYTQRLLSQGSLVRCGQRTPSGRFCSDQPCQKHHGSCFALSGFCNVKTFHPTWQSPARWGLGSSMDMPFWRAGRCSLHAYRAVVKAAPWRMEERVCK